MEGVSARPGRQCPFPLFPAFYSLLSPCPLWHSTVTVTKQNLDQISLVTFTLCHPGSPYLIVEGDAAHTNQELERGLWIIQSTWKLQPCKSNCFLPFSFGMSSLSLPCIRVTLALHPTIVTLPLCKRKSGSKRCYLYKIEIWQETGPKQNNIIWSG